MSIFDDEPQKRTKPYEIGQDLSLLSIQDLTTHIDALRCEIARLEAEVKAKDQSKSAAEALFRRS